MWGDRSRTEQTPGNRGGTEKKEGTSMVFEKIERLSIAVKDLDRSIEFFSQLLDITFDEAL
ncbi:hypothetical protein LDC_2599 [sediment metagenome]|uniref:Uncharacterized protein n=1 Tax=sediment metagenome TaxID=749907 RepID=D9PM21_9ZZZZ